MDFYEVFEIQDAIDQGGFGKAFRCFKKGNNEMFAVKVVTVKNEEERVCVNTEAAIWRRLKHENVVNFHRVFKSLEKYYLVMEFVDGENLFDSVVSSSIYTEHDACHFMKQIFQALDYCHGKNIIHRNIKPDNILVCKNGSISTLKITDFSLALRLRKGTDVIECAPNGTALYAAPEILQRQPIRFEVDLWACGVILFTLSGGYPPFWSERPEKLVNMVIHHDYSFSSPYWDNVSVPVKDLIMGLLQKDPKKRITASQALQRDWSNTLNGAARPHRYATLQHLRSFKPREKIQSAVLTVQALSRLQPQKSQPSFTSVPTLNLKRKGKDYPGTKLQESHTCLLEVNENEG